jgi:ribose-phosphate pyrophosphokinase
MTTLALSSAPLRRLFDRLDFAPRPRESALVAALESWSVIRNGRIAPAYPLPSESLGVATQVFIEAERQRDYVLKQAGSDTTPLLGPIKEGALLSAVPNRRSAVRLRRLIELVVSKGEPLFASFSMKPFHQPPAIVDLIAAPIADPNGRICGALVASEVRHAGPIDGPPGRRREEDDMPALYSLGGSGALATTIANNLGIDVAEHEERDFEDGEHKIRPLTSVRNREVYVLANLVSSPGQSVNDKLCKLLFFLDALKRSAARRITVVAPYLCYSRKERQTKTRDPVVTSALAKILEAVGVDCVMTLTAHDLAAFQNAFRCSTEHLDAYALFAHALAPRLLGRRISVISPDPGGEKRAELFRRILERTLSSSVGKGLVDKSRSLGQVTGEIFAGDVDGRTAIVLDDMISTGGTMVRAATACRAHGATEVLAVATHGLFVDGGQTIASTKAIDEIWVTDSLPIPTAVSAAVARGRARVVPIGELLAKAIARCYGGGSINELLEHEDV